VSALAVQTKGFGVVVVRGNVMRNLGDLIWHEAKYAAA
jgi:hypothetical protein